MAAVGTLLAVLAVDDSVRCPLADFARSVTQLCDEDSGSNLGGILADKSQALVEEENSIAAATEQCILARDKLQAELHRVEAQLRQLEQRKKQLEEQKKLCRLGLNAVVSGVLDSGHPAFYTDSHDGSHLRSKRSLGRVGSMDEAHHKSIDDPYGDDANHHDDHLGMGAGDPEEAERSPPPLGNQSHRRFDDQYGGRAEEPHATPRSAPGRLAAQQGRVLDVNDTQEALARKLNDHDDQECDGGASTVMMPPQQLAFQRSAASPSKSSSREQDTRPRNTRHEPSSSASATPSYVTCDTASPSLGAAEPPSDVAEQHTVATGARAPVGGSSSRRATSPVASSPRGQQFGGSNLGSSGRALISMLQMPDVKEAALLKALSSYETHQLQDPVGGHRENADGDLHGGSTGGAGSKGGALPSVGATLLTKTQEDDLLPVVIALLAHLPQPRPPVQHAELRIICAALRHSSPMLLAALNAATLAKADGEVNSGRGSTMYFPVLVRLLGSGNDEIKCEILDCLSLLCSPPATTGVALSGSTASDGGTATTALQRHGSTDISGERDRAKLALVAEQNSFTSRSAFVAANGLEPLVNIVASSTSEAVLERALVFLWSCLLSTTARDDDEVDNSNSTISPGSTGKPPGSAVRGRRTNSIRCRVRELGGLRALLDLLYTDSMPILDNVAMSIGYLTREEECKVEMRESGGLEKITATLRHPSPAIQTKVAGAVWNCASNTENRSYLRNVGCIPAILELLSARPRNAGLPPARFDGDDSLPKDEVWGPYQFVQENAAGALWNLSVDVENKKQIVDYGGIPILLQLIAESSSVSVIENSTGTLWNCSAANEVRPAIRKAGGLPVLLGILSLKPHSAETSVPYAAETTKSSRGRSSVAEKIADSHPVFSPSLRVNHKVIDNVVGTLRNCAITDQNKPAIREAGGVELLLHRLEDAIMTRIAYAAQKDGLSPPPPQQQKAGGGERSGRGGLLKKADATEQPALAASVPISSHDVMPMSTLEKLASTLWIVTVAPEIKHTVRLCGGLSQLARLLVASTGPSGGSSATGPIPMSVKEKMVGILRNCSTVQENRAPMVEAGVVRALVSLVRASTAPATSAASAGASKAKVTPNATAAGAPSALSMHLQETVASCLWYLSRDDKNTPREEGGLQLMCEFLLSPSTSQAGGKSNTEGGRSRGERASCGDDSSVVVQEQAAGCLSSLTVNNAENRRKLRECGGLEALMNFVVEKAAVAFPASAQPSSATVPSASSAGRSGSGTNGMKDSVSNPSSAVVSHTYAILNSLLAIRNSTSTSGISPATPGSASLPASSVEKSLLCSKDNIQLVSASTPFLDALLYLVDHGSEECAREAALCIKNVCYFDQSTSPAGSNAAIVASTNAALDFLLQKGVVTKVTSLAERAATDAAKRAAAITLQTVNKGKRR